MIRQNTLPLINEFLRVIGEEVLLMHLDNQSTTAQKNQIAVCTRVLLDEWFEKPWTATSENGDKLIELFKDTDTINSL